MSWLADLLSGSTPPHAIEVEAVAAKDREHADAILELWARQPELARILGRVSEPEERRQQYCMRAQPPGEGLTAGLSPGGDRCQALA